ncbi:hypothetical protein HPP92_026596 [Vanilla planifolia]|uniref:Uncharacterized protein n=1 Tax=Vanilla planifolia TaxID=51239 RepID=A0A835PIY1_VANPL|nr:hypothetical protein HPP92_026596 [Vanilla planifolia]
MSPTSIEYEYRKDEWYEKLHQEAKVLHYLVAIKAQEKEAEARAASENLHYGLMEDLEKATQEINNLNSQMKMIQGTNKLLQEYNNSLHQYNIQLQADAIKNEEGRLDQGFVERNDESEGFESEREERREEASMLEIYIETICD